MGCPKLMPEYYNECNWSANISEGATNFLSRLTQATDSNEGQLDTIIDRQYDKNGRVTQETQTVGAEIFTVNNSYTVNG